VLKASGFEPPNSGTLVDCYTTVLPTLANVLANFDDISPSATGIWIQITKL